MSRGTIADNAEHMASRVPTRSASSENILLPRKRRFTELLIALSRLLSWIPKRLDLIEANLMGKLPQKLYGIFLGHSAQGLMSRGGAPQSVADRGPVELCAHA